MKNRRTIILIMCGALLASFLGGYFFAAQQVAQYEKKSSDNVLLYASQSWNKDFYDNAYAHTPTLPKSIPGTFGGGVVNHHLLAPHLISQVFETLQTNEPISIVLISPDHFSRGDSFVTTTSRSWNTPYGTLDADEGLVNALASHRTIAKNSIPFEEEHGIANIIPFVHKSFPRARVIPLIVKESTPPDSIDEIAESIHNVLPQKSLVIGSFDFSHSLSPEAAEFHDITSTSVLETYDLDTVDTLDIDSARGLRLLMQLMQKRHTPHFVMLHHTNSAEIIHDPTLLDTTSYITGVFSDAENERAPRTTTLLATGDMMLGRYVRGAIERNTSEYPFERIERMLRGNDITVANLEGTITDFPPEPLDPNNVTFTFDPSITPYLRTYGFDTLGLGNNHSQDYGSVGLDQTKTYISQAGMNYFGDWENKQDISIIRDVRGMKIALVGYHEFSYRGFDTVLNEIQNLEATADYTIVFPHWGVEYDTEFSTAQQKMAHAFVDAGADVILGAHPHVVQPIEEYNGRLIFYSLGNFIFDQTFSENTTQGLAVGIVFYEKDMDFYLFPLEIVNLQPQLMDFEKRGILLGTLADTSRTSKKIKEGIQQGIILHTNE